MHFLQPNSAVFIELKHYILSTKLVYQSASFPLLALKLLMSLFKENVSFSSKFGSLFSVVRDNSSAHFLLKLFVLLTKGVYQKADF